MIDEQTYIMCPVEGLEVSRDGLVRRAENKTIVKQWDNGNGYMYISFRSKKYAVHRLVAGGFSGLPSGGLEVRHLDGVRANNHASNLVWGTRSENIRDQVTHGTHRTAGKRSATCKRGHAFTDANTYLWRGVRHCRECKKLWS